MLGLLLSKEEAEEPTAPTVNIFLNEGTDEAQVKKKTRPSPIPRIGLNEVGMGIFQLLKHTDGHAGKTKFLSDGRLEHF